MSHFFQFESDFVESLRCIPMSVRLKLDSCGVKLKLTHWNQLTQAERLQVIEMPCSTSDEVETYRSLLHYLVEQHGSDRPADLPIDSHPAWIDTTQIPETVQARATELGVMLTLEQWENLEPVQRFALIKLSRSSHENSNFLPAFKEFGLY
jgi:hypothetical protein